MEEHFLCQFNRARPLSEKLKRKGAKTQRRRKKETPRLGFSLCLLLPLRIPHKFHKPEQEISLFMLP